MLYAAFVDVEKTPQEYCFLSVRVVYTQARISCFSEMTQTRKKHRNFMHLDEKSITDSSQ